MALVRYQCHLILLVVVFLVVRPTVELIMRNSANEGKKSLSETGTIRETQTLSEQHEGLGYRPSERDKPHQLRPTRSAESSTSDVIVFPDQMPPHSSSQNGLDSRLFVVPNTAAPPPCARGNTFCEAVDEYPTERVLQVLKNEPVFIRRFFQEDRKEYSNAEDNVEDRIDSSDESPLCIAQEETIFPQLAKNIEGNWLFVINQAGCKQGVRVEKCVSDRECSIPASLPLGYRSQCKQKHIYRRLVALNSSGHGMTTDSFPLPSCCSCVIRFDRNLAHNRVGDGAPLPLTLPKTTPTPRP